MKDYFARLTPEQRAAHGGLNPTPDTLEKRWVGARAAKKEAYAADEPARNARASARAAEEQAQAEARAKALAARAEARAAQEKARADALVATLAELTELTEEETAALIAKGGRAVESARRAFVARATDVALETKGPAGAKKTKRRQQDREYSEDYRKQKKAKVEGLVQDEAQLTEECVALLGRLGCGGSPVLDDDDAAGEIIDRDDIREDEEALQDLVDAKNRGAAVDAKEIKRKRGALTAKRGRARKKAKLEKDQLRVKALEGRVGELEKEECYLGDVLSVI